MLYLPERKLYYAHAIPGVAAQSRPTGGGAVNPSFVSASAAYVSSTAAISHTFAHTVASVGANRKLFVGTARQIDPPPDITNITYNGVALTKLNDSSNASPTPDVFIELWYLDHADMPTDGVSHNVVITCDSMNVIAAVIEYKDIKQGAPTVSSVGVSIASGTLTSLTLVGMPAGGAMIGICSLGTTSGFANVPPQNDRVIGTGTPDSVSLLLTDELNVPGGDDTLSADPNGTGAARFVASGWGAP